MKKLSTIKFENVGDAKFQRTLNERDLDLVVGGRAVLTLNTMTMKPHSPIVDDGADDAKGER